MAKSTINLGPQRDPQAVLSKEQLGGWIMQIAMLAKCRNTADIAMVMAHHRVSPVIALGLATAVRRDVQATTALIAYERGLRATLPAATVALSDSHTWLPDVIVPVARMLLALPEAA